MRFILLLLSFGIGGCKTGVQNSEKQSVGVAESSGKVAVYQVDVAHLNQFICSDLQTATTNFTSCSKTSLDWTDAEKEFLAQGFSSAEIANLKSDMANKDLLDGNDANVKKYSDAIAKVFDTVSPTGVIFHHRLIAGGGVQAQTVTTSATPSLTSISAIGAPTSRSGHCAVGIGTKMFIWGGFDTSYSSDGAVFDTATNSWSALPLGGPTGRFLPTAVVIGTKMIIWGGYNLAGRTKYNNDGAIFDAATNSWSVIPNTGAPSPRGGHSAVAIGTKMIVWGGHDGTNYINDGAIFDTATNSWSALPIIGTPTPRRQHSAVGIGTKMIVWAGFDGHNHLNDMAIFDTSTNSWSTLPNAGTPTPRSEHSATVVGTKMVVWGGYDGKNWLNEGAIFDIATNLWAALPNTKAPAARLRHSAVAIGTKIIIWGGLSVPDMRHNDGAIFDLATVTWSQ